VSCASHDLGENGGQVAVCGTAGNETFQITILSTKVVLNEEVQRTTHQQGKQLRKRVHGQEGGGGMASGRMGEVHSLQLMEGEGPHTPTEEAPWGRQGIASARREGRDAGSLRTRLALTAGWARVLQSNPKSLCLLKRTSN
jgi:hypothetical protein